MLKPFTVFTLMPSYDTNNQADAFSAYHASFVGWQLLSFILFLTIKQYSWGRGRDTSMHLL